MSDNVDDFLAHYGVKGMRWGVRRKDPSGGSSSGTSSVSPMEAAAKAKSSAPKSSTPAPSKKDAAAAAKVMHDFAESKGASPMEMAAKYGPASAQAKYPKRPLNSGLVEPPGPPTPVVDDRNFYQRHKTAINTGAVVVGAGLAIYGANKYGSVRAQRAYDRNPTYENTMALAKRSKKGLLKDYNDKAMAKQGSDIDPDKLGTTPVNLKAGSIVRRISTENESSVRPGGFYASFDDDDVNRYKAILPTYWKQWGMPNVNGYVVNLKANKDVKAPSAREAYDIYANLLKNNADYRSEIDPFNVFPDVDALARKTYPAAAGAWINNDAPLTKMYFDEVKRRGYNALIDQNDAGSLSKTPMRFLDGSMFDLQPANPLTEKAIAEAQISEAAKVKQGRK